MKFMPGALGAGGGKDLYSLIRRTIGVEGLILCLDAGSKKSFNPSVDDQTWFDLSGNGHHWQRGTTSSAQDADPSFNGTPGGLSENEYWSFDHTKGQHFTQATEDFFATPLHLNAGQGTAVAIAEMGGTDWGFPIFFGGGPTQSSNDVVYGYRFGMGYHAFDHGGYGETTDRLLLSASRTAAGAFGQYKFSSASNTLPAITAGEMMFVAGTHADEGDLRLYYNKTEYEDSSGGSDKNLSLTEYTPARPYFIGSSYINTQQYYAEAGSKLWALALFNIQKPTAGIHALYDLCRASGRFPSLPV